MIFQEHQIEQHNLFLEKIQQDKIIPCKTSSIRTVNRILEEQEKWNIDDCRSLELQKIHAINGRLPEFESVNQYNSQKINLQIANPYTKNGQKIYEDICFPPKSQNLPGLYIEIKTGNDIEKIMEKLKREEEYKNFVTALIFRIKNPLLTLFETGLEYENHFKKMEYELIKVYRRINFNV